MVSTFPGLFIERSVVMRKNIVPLYYFVRQSFSLDRTNVDLLLGCGLLVPTGTCFFESFQRSGFWEPEVIAVLHSEHLLKVQNSFQQGSSFSFHVWGPYLLEDFQRGLWRFRGSIGSDQHNWSLLGAGKQEARRLIDSERADVVRQENFQAIIGRALLTYDDGHFRIAQPAQYDGVLT